MLIFSPNNVKQRRLFYAKSSLSSSCELQAMSRQAQQSCCCRCSQRTSHRPKLDQSFLKFQKWKQKATRLQVEAKRMEQFTTRCYQDCRQHKNSVPGM